VSLHEGGVFTFCTCAFSLFLFLSAHSRSLSLSFSLHMRVFSLPLSLPLTHPHTHSPTLMCTGSVRGQGVAEGTMIVQNLLMTGLVDVSLHGDGSYSGYKFCGGLHLAPCAQCSCSPFPPPSLLLSSLSSLSPCLILLRLRLRLPPHVIRARRVRGIDHVEREERGSSQIYNSIEIWGTVIAIWVCVKALPPINHYHAAISGVSLSKGFVVVWGVWGQVGFTGAFRGDSATR